jgi:hypothetical protein
MHEFLFRWVGSFVANQIRHWLTAKLFMIMEVLPCNFVLKNKRAWKIFECRMQEQHGKSGKSEGSVKDWQQIEIRLQNKLFNVHWKEGIKARELLETDRKQGGDIQISFRSTTKAAAG